MSGAHHHGASGAQPSRDSRAADSLPAREHAQAAISASPQEAVVAELRDRVIMLAEQRGALRAAIVQDAAALKLIDHQLDAAVTESLRLVPAGRPEYQDIHRTALEAQDEVRLESAERLLRESAVRCGLAQGRTLDIATVEKEREFMRTYRAAQHDLFTHYPELAARVDGLLEAEERRGLRMRLDADKIAITIAIAVRRVIPDAKTVIDALSNKNAHELSLIKEAFAERYDIELGDFIRVSFARKGVSLVLPSEAIVERALDLLAGKRCPNDTVYTSHVARFMKEGIDKLMPQAAQRAALHRDSSIEAKAELIARYLEAGPRKAHKIAEVIERLGRDRLGALRAAFSVCRPGADFDASINGLADGYTKDRIKAFIENDTRRYNAATVGSCIERIGKMALIPLLGEYHREGRRNLIKDFQGVYQTDFWARIEDKLRRSDVHFIRALYEHEEVPKAEYLWHCVDGNGTDEQGIRRVLSGMRAADIEILKAEYYQLSRGRTWTGWPEKLENRLRWETSGDAWHDVERLLKGVPEDVHVMHARLMEDHAHERSGPWIRRVDRFSLEGSVMDREVAVADDYYQQHIKNKTPTPQELRRFETLVRFCNRDMTGFRMTKNDWSDFVANSGSAIAALCSVLPLAHFTHGLAGGPYAHAALVAVSAGIIQGGVQFVMKWKLKGDGYGREEKLRDVALSTLRAGSFYLSKFLPVSVLRRPIDMGTKMGLKTIVRLGETSDAQRTPAHALSLRDLRHALDADGHLDDPYDAESGLSDEVGSRTTCAVDPADAPFNGALRRLLAH